MKRRICSYDLGRRSRETALDFGQTECAARRQAAHAVLLETQGRQKSRGVMRRILATILLCAWATLAGRGQGIAFERAAHLQRGINLSMWYAQARDYLPSA